MIFVAAIVLLFAALAAVPNAPRWLPGALLPPYFMIGLTGQIFAFLGLFVSVALAIIADGAAAWTFAVAAALCLFVHMRNRIAARLLLDGVGLTDTRIPFFAGLFAFAVGDWRVRRVKDLAYGDAGERNLLDIVLPKQPPAGPMPILIHIHGGAWVFGGKNQQGKPLLNHLVPNGWMGVDINYRLGPASRFPAMIVDVLKAIAWVRQHAHEYGGDPTRIALTGGSAGGQLAALAALAHDDPAFKPGFEDADCSVAAAVPVYGRYDLLDRLGHMKNMNRFAVDDFMASRVMPGTVASCGELWLALSPVERVRADAPAMLILHGTGDAILPFKDARDFAEALRRVSRSPVTLIELPGIEHAYDMAATTVTWAHVRAVERFLAPLARPAQDGERRADGLRGEGALALAG